MSNQRYNEIDKECPICGSIIWGKGQKVLLEGAKITVCHNCAQHGTKIEKSSPISDIRKKKTQIRVSSIKQRRSEKDSIENVELIPEYSKIIRNARNSCGLNQDQFAQKLNEKPSLLRRIETGKVKPTIMLAKKIEEVYKIKILKKVDEIEANIQESKYMKKSSGTSLGDIAFIKKKK